MEVFPNKSWAQPAPTAPTAVFPNKSWVQLDTTPEPVVVPEADTALTNTVVVTSGEALGGHRVVMMKTDTAVYYDPSSSSNTGKAVGVTLAAYANRVPATIVTAGPVTNPGWNLSPGEPYYALPNGMISTAAPTLGIVQRVGVALTADTLNVHLSEPYILI